MFLIVVLRVKYLDLTVDWKKIYSLVFSVTFKDTRLRALQCIALNDKVFTNTKPFTNLKSWNHCLYTRFVGLKRNLSSICWFNF